MVVGGVVGVGEDRDGGLFFGGVVRIGVLRLLRTEGLPVCREKSREIKARRLPTAGASTASIVYVGFLKSDTELIVC